MESDKYKAIYLSEAEEILKELNTLLVNFEKAPGNTEIVNNIFRLFHTLKGMSATMGYNEAVKLTHEMESILGQMRAGKMDASAPIVSLLFESVDTLGGLIGNIKGIKTKKIDIAPIIKKLTNLGGLAQPPSPPLAGQAGTLAQPSGQAPQQHIEMELEEKDKEATKGVYRVEVSLEKSCCMPACRALVLLQELKKYGTILSEEKLITRIKELEFVCELSFFYKAQFSPAAIKEKVSSIPEVEGIRFSPSGRLAHAPVDGADRRTADNAAPTIRLEVEKLDRLMNLIGEFVINKIRLTQISSRLESKDLDEAVAAIERLSAQMQIEMMDIRLFPLGYIFGNFPRMVRDLAKGEGKEVDLIVEGAEIGLDRAILDEINQPLIHILRNAVSHGIEALQDRTSSGKNRRGVIHLSAMRERNYIIIDVSDDGAGMDASLVRKVAVKKGIIPEEEAAGLSDEEAFMLITHPNFSTAKKATETSGRGVGMSVVKTAVESLGGTLSIESQVGKGASFRLRLPLSVAIIQALLVGLGGEVCVIPLNAISEAIKIKPDAIKAIGAHSEAITYRDMALPLIRLREKLGFAVADGAERGNGTLSVVVVELGTKKAGLITDSFLGQQEVVVKGLTGSLKRIKGVSGATILGSGKVALIIDVAAVIK